ncbi:hypothetical protein CCACVL1_24033 [Corchorus capsularis]|uniref:Uncharacterized protein n=1 Tax=Corchorus capsularis TaxID=210143 RepID=A0A1R3GRA0_COCAP|nr:hypothetical protein CCACVL1_24033 [Corchorus capsularis]
MAGDRTTDFHTTRTRPTSEQD